MKKRSISHIVLSSCAFTLLSFNTLAQTETKEVSTMKTADKQSTSWSYTYEVDSTKLATKIDRKESIEGNVKDVAYYENFIKALYKKRKYIMNDPEERALAEETGWFEQIDLEIEKAKAEREVLLKK